MPRFTYGGQALIEGVMMRGRDAVAVALRHPDGRIVYATEQLESGFRGKPAADVDALAQAAVRFGDMFLATPDVREFEMNPVIVKPRGQGLSAVDALVTLSPSAGRAS